MKCFWKILFAMVTILALTRVPVCLADDYGTNLWLEVHPVTNGSVLVVLHNVQQGGIYELLSKVSLLNPVWNGEANLYPVLNQSTITTNISLAHRTNTLFFRVIRTDGGMYSSYSTDGLAQWNRLIDANGTNAADSSGFGNTFPLIGAPTWGTGSLILNGSSQYGDAGSGRFNNLDYHDLTICAWLNKTGSSQKGIVDKSYSDPNVGYGGWSFQVLADNRLQWWLQNGQEMADISGEIVPPGQWTFVAVVYHYPAQQADFYINGIKSSSVKNGAAFQGTSGPAHLLLGNIHNNAEGGLYAFDGSMRDVAIYNRALSPAEIESNYFGSATTTNVSTPDLLYYKMTEYALTNPPVSLVDSSTHGGTTGTVFSSFPTTLQWETNVASIPQTALHFNGVSTHIDTSNTTLFNFTTNLFTINLWLRPLTADGSLMQNGSAQTNGWYLDVGGSYQISFGTASNGINTAIQTDSTAVRSGLFTMVTIVRSGPTNAAIYLNGIQTHTTGAITSPASSSSSLMIGIDRAGSHVLDGEIWLPQIWSRPLNEAEIANLYLVQSFGHPFP